MCRSIVVGELLCGGSGESRGEVWEGGGGGEERGVGEGGVVFDLFGEDGEDDKKVSLINQKTKTRTPGRTQLCHQY